MRGTLAANRRFELIPIKPSHTEQTARAPDAAAAMSSRRTRGDSAPAAGNTRQRGAGIPATALAGTLPSSSDRRPGRGCRAARRLRHPRQKTTGYPPRRLRFPALDRPRRSSRCRTEAGSTCPSAAKAIMSFGTPRGSASFAACQMCQVLPYVSANWRMTSFSALSGMPGATSNPAFTSRTGLCQKAFSASRSCRNNLSLRTYSTSTSLASLPLPSWMGHCLTSSLRTAQ